MRTSAMIFSNLIRTILIFAHFSTNACHHISDKKALGTNISNKEVRDFFSALPNDLALHRQTSEITVYKVFAPWCQSCLHEIALIEAYEQSPSENALNFIFLSTEPINDHEFTKLHFAFIPEIIESLGIFQVPQTYVFKNKHLIQTYSHPLTHNDLNAFVKLAKKTSKQTNTPEPAALY